MLLLSLLLQANHVTAQDGPVYRTETFRVSDAAEVNVRTSGGTIEVTGHDGNEVKVEMFVRKRGDWIEAGEADLSDYEIIIEQDGNKVIASARNKRNGISWGSSYSISFRVMAPVNSQTDLRTSGGTVSADNLIGNQELRTSGGTVSATRIKGNVDMRTSGGALNIQEIRGTVNGRTSGGSIRAENVIGNIELRTSGGAIRLNGISGNVDARTSGGAIIAGVDQPGDRIELRTSGGSIEIRVPGDRGYNLDLKGNGINGALRDFTGSSDRRRVEGQVRGGGTLIEARTSSGSVTLNYF